MNTSESALRRSVFIKHIELLDIDRSSRSITEGGISGIRNESFEVGQLARISQTTKTVLGMSARFAAKESGLSEMIRQRQTAATMLGRYTENLMAALSMSAVDREPDVENELRSSITKTRALMAGIDRNIGKKYPKYYELISPEPLTIDKVQALLNKDEALVSVLLGQRGSYLWIIKQDDALFVPLDITSDAVEKSIGSIRKNLQDYAYNPTLVNGVRGEDVYPVDEAYKLYRSLFGGVAEALKSTKHIIFVPDGALFSLPLEVLVTEKANMAVVDSQDLRALSWFVDKYAVSYLPSVSSFSALRSLAGKSRASHSFLGIGDPLLSGHQGLDSEKQATNKTDIVPRGITARAGLMRGSIADVKELFELAH